jgi:hypothetical protein
LTPGTANLPLAILVALCFSSSGYRKASLAAP